MAALRPRLPLPLLVLLALAAPARADEGMWTYNNFPAPLVESRYGFRPTPEWLDKVRLASVRLAGGCSGSFVSPDGLVMTNHHCARECIEQLSTARRNYLEAGFSARTLRDEPKCPTVEVNKLLSIQDVTQQVQQATQGLEGERFYAARKAVFARLESACATAKDVRCDVVTLYQGGRYDLYKYQRFQDVRLVFAPESSIAFFGGDPDNFEFPRYDYDLSFLRVYQDGKPARVEQYFPFSARGAQAGELTFVSGNPGRTSRLDTVAQLTYARDVALPERLFWLAELRGLLDEFARRGPEQRRIATGLRFGVDNSYKALRGRRDALVDPRFFAQLVAREKELRDKVKANPESERRAGPAWDAIAQAMDRLRPMRKELRLLEQNAGAGSRLFEIARTLVRAAAEQPRPNEERLPEFTEAQRPQLEQELFSTAPIYPELETLQLTYWLRRMQEDLGPDHPVVKKLLGKQSPQALAQQLVRGTKLADLKLRRRLYEGGQKAVAGSDDAMVAFVRALDEPARAVRKRYEDTVESVLEQAGERIARARFDAYGTAIYPDGTFTPRVSFGQVKGYREEDGRFIEPITVVSGLYARATGQDPFALPRSWEQARPKLAPTTPMNFVTTNDIIGGNSGSPVINKDAQVVGLIFDGNIHSLGGEYGFDEATNRAVAVHSEVIEAALQKVYGTERLMKELGLPKE